MNPLLPALLLLCGTGPEIVFDNRPDAGVPPEALAQKPDEHPDAPAGGRPRTLRSMTEGTIKAVRIRYFNKETWPTEGQARDYVGGFLADTSTDVSDFQNWSQVVFRPEIECVVEFSDASLEKLRREGKPSSREGRLILWNTESCFRDATGRWRFVSAFHHFHKSHPHGERGLARDLPLLGRPGLPVGRWNIEFANGVAETCVIREDGTASVVEPLRSSGGKAAVEGGSSLIRFDDDRIERWTPVGTRMVVEHWPPGSTIEAAKPVLGVADRGP